MTSEGVLYIAFGAPHLLMALNSARTFRLTNPGRGITVVTNVRVPAEVAIDMFDPESDRLVVQDAEDARNRRFKTSANALTDYGQTLLLDADTVVLKNLDIPFQLLDYADVLLKLDPKGQNRPWQKHEQILDLGEFGDLPAWNSGVVFFRRCPAVDDFFHVWGEKFVAKGSPYDQPALLESTLTTGVRILPLDMRWNCPTGQFDRTGGLDGPVSILHYMSEIPAEVVNDIRDFSARFDGSQIGEMLRFDFDRHIASRAKPVPTKHPFFRRALRAITSPPREGT